MKGVLAFDLGTSSVKCSIYTADGRRAAETTREYPTFYPGSDMRVQRPGDWAAAVADAAAELASSGFFGCEIAAIGLSGHSLGAVPVDRRGRCLCDEVPIWSDARAVGEAEKFFAKIDRRTWYERTGNGFPSQLYSLFKIMWLRKHLPEIYERTYKFLGTKDYINLLLCGEFATDRSSASGSGAYDLATGEYLGEYLDAAETDVEKLPRIAASDEIIGRVTAAASERFGIPAGIPVVSGGVDNACMTLGADCRRDGDSYASLGSSAWVSVTTDRPVVNFESKIYTFAHCLEGMFLPSAGIFASGSALLWTADGFFADLDGSERFKAIDGLAAQSNAGANGLVFYPSLAGGSAFDPSPDVRGCLYGLDLKHTRADVARAVLEGIAMHLHSAYRALDVSADSILLVGGGAKSPLWRQLYADIFGLTAVRTQVGQDAASLGAASLAAVGSGVWSSYDMITTVHGERTETRVRPETAEAYSALTKRFDRLAALCGEMTR